MKILTASHCTSVVVSVALLSAAPLLAYREWAARVPTELDTNTGLQTALMALPLTTAGFAQCESALIAYAASEASIGELLPDYERRIDLAKIAPDDILYPALDVGVISSNVFAANLAVYIAAMRLLEQTEHDLTQYVRSASSRADPLFRDLASANALCSGECIDDAARSKLQSLDTQSKMTMLVASNPLMRLVAVSHISDFFDTQSWVSTLMHAATDSCASVQYQAARETERIAPNHFLEVSNLVYQSVALPPGSTNEPWRTNLTHAVDMLAPH